MLFKKKYERAQKWLHDQNPDNQFEDDGELPSMEELRAQANEEIPLDKSDVFAMVFAAFVTIVPACLLILLIIVGVGLLLF
ncbi:MAG: hypothetical protein IKJ99_05240 [Oscillospiraceae bacterium]|nr:hypothetical protein [Oscillospiraceae bacterium]